MPMGRLEVSFEACPKEARWARALGDKGKEEHWQWDRYTPLPRPPVPFVKTPNFLFCSSCQNSPILTSSSPTWTPLTFQAIAMTTSYLSLRTTEAPPPLGSSPTLCLLPCLPLTLAPQEPAPQATPRWDHRPGVAGEGCLGPQPVSHLNALSWGYGQSRP